MLDPNAQISVLTQLLAQRGFSPVADAKSGTITLETLPEFRERLAFTLVINMDKPLATAWGSLFDGCVLESGRLAKGGAHGFGIYSRKKMVERAKQEKWAASWALYDAGIFPPGEKPAWESWQEVTLP